MVSGAEKAQLKVDRMGSWVDYAEPLLMPSMRDPLFGIQSVRNMVEEGTATLFVIYLVANGEDRPVGAFVVTVNHYDFGSEAVVVVASGHLPGVNMTRLLFPVIEQEFSSCTRVRILASRKGMVRNLERLGFKAVEINMIKEIR